MSVAEVAVPAVVEQLADPFDVPVDPVLDALWRAADLIEEHGHTKHDLGGPERGFCVNGALNYVVTGDAMGQAVEAKAFLRRALGLPTVLPWNNAPDRTKEDVVAKLRELADGLA